MNSKRTFSQKAGDFLAGKGFYIVLLLCMAVIGVSAWLLIFAGKNEDSGSVNDQLTNTIQSRGLNEPDVSTSGVNGSYAGDKQETGLQKAENDSTQVISPINPEDDDGEEIESSAQSAEGEKTGSVDQQVEETSIEDLTFVWPVAGDIISDYSIEVLAFDKTMGDWRTHPAVDVSAEIGTKVLSAAEGTVCDIYEDEMYGTTVVIDHGNGLKSYCSNLAKVPTVAVGDKVSMGDTIGSVGDTALAETGIVTHLHFQMTLNDEYVDPVDYLPGR